MIRELEGSLAHACDVWKPDRAYLSTQAHTPNASIFILMFKDIC